MLIGHAVSHSQTPLLLIIGWTRKESGDIQLPKCTRNRAHQSDCSIVDYASLGMDPNFVKEDAHSSIRARTLLTS